MAWPEHLRFMNNVINSFKGSAIFYGNLVHKLLRGNLPDNNDVVKIIICNKSTTEVTKIFTKDFNVNKFQITTVTDELDRLRFRCLDQNFEVHVYSNYMSKAEFNNLLDAEDYQLGYNGVLHCRPKYFERLKEGV